MGTLKKVLVLVISLGLVSFSNAQQVSDQAKAPQEEDKSPWLIVPLLSSNPKLETALGALVGYIAKFDEKSRTSLFAVSAKYTTSDSIIANLIAKTSFGEDYHRITSGIAAGKINNDYQDYLGTGQSIDTEDKLRAAFFRYVYRFYGNFFGGFQALMTNYQLVGRSTADDEILDDLGLAGYKSGGVGLVLVYDSRDNDFMPKHGWYFNANNASYRESLGGDTNFDIYRADLRYFFNHGKDNVLAFRQRNQWASENTPPGAYSPIYLRGYTPGEYLAQSMSSIEVEERLSWSEKWTSTFFGGVALLYGNGSDRYDYDNFPAIGAGVQYILKPQAGLVANLEGAAGRGDNNNGIYIKMGYSF